MNVWTEKSDEAQTATTRAVMSDAVFKIDCPQLPVDHAAELSQVIVASVPWLGEHNDSGVHPIHVAGSQNGWQRPDAGGQEPLILSKRTRLRVRCPADRSEELINSLADTTHTVGGYTLKVITGRAMPLQRTATLFARYVVYNDTSNDEDVFLQNVVNECGKLGYQPTKLLCGMSNTVATPAGSLEAKSLLIADVPPEYSLPLQEKGLGEFRLMGCGMLIPHKGTEAVN